MSFSVVTASFRQAAWLRRCVRSVADQFPLDGARPEVEHIVQDAGTGPVLEDWIRENSPARLFVEPDTGIYDALNRGFAHGTGEIFSFLNCDEQYLPGTLQCVWETFAANPKADLVVGDCLVLGPDSQLLSFRRSTPLRPSMILTDHLYDFTCAIFFRRRVLERAGPFRTDFRAAGDAEWISRVLQGGARAAYLPRYLATFSLTGENASLRADVQSEAGMLRAIAPAWARLAGPLLRQFRHCEKLLAGGYRSAPIAYAVYAGADDVQRTKFLCERPSSRHPWSR